mmetsp:Transcript_12134/g.26409  ORF Transcript_12134/g.26409 Transcript_12134/m.26409 type:complete len:162 (-) Transcript_12134:79-564(-)
MNAITKVLRKQKMSKHCRCSAESATLNSTTTKQSGKDVGYSVDSNHKKRKVIRDEGAPSTKTAITTWTDEMVSLSSGSTAIDDDSFEPKPSKRLSKLHIPLLENGDGDTWIEMLVTNLRCKKTKELKSRSLFYSVKTRQALWDEPPTGASRVIYLRHGQGE